MNDITQGVARSRAWPRKRGPAKTKAQRDSQDHFAQAQLATKYWQPELYANAIKAVAGTPLLPRDVMTMIMYNRLTAFDLPDGRTLWPMPARNDVSEALDVITNKEGDILVRRDQGWVGEPRSSGGGGADWSVYANDIITPGSNNLVYHLTAPINDLAVVALNLAASSSGGRQIHLSTDHGATWWESAGDYLILAETGVASASSVAFGHTGSTTAARTCGGLILGLGYSVAARQCLSILPGSNRLFVASTLPINAIRIRTSSGTLSSGRVVILAR